MSRICKVKSENRIRYIGITHVDNTARIQTVNKNLMKSFTILLTSFIR